MTLNSSNFILLLTASTKLEDRFIFDMEWGVRLLKNKGVSAERFVIVTDESRAELDGKCPILKDIQSVQSSELYHLLGSCECENLFVISNCHGNIDGVDSVSTITPYPFTVALKSNPHIKNAVVVFGQCYAGIFNYSDLSDTNIIYLGVTDIDYGFSTLQSFGGRSWAANIPVLCTFDWLNNLVDIDKDGNASIVDLYKYVTFTTNQIIRQCEKQHNRLLVEAFQSSTALLTSPNPYIKTLYQDAMQSLQDYTFVRQNTWILNAKPAGSMYVTA